MSTIRNSWLEWKVRWQNSEVAEQSWHELKPLAKSPTSEKNYFGFIWFPCYILKPKTFTLNRCVQIDRSSNAAWKPMVRSWKMFRLQLALYRLLLMSWYLNCSICLAEERYLVWNGFSFKMKMPLCFWKVGFLWQSGCVTIHLVKKQVSLTALDVVVGPNLKVKSQVWQVQTQEIH